MTSRIITLATFVTLSVASQSNGMIVNGDFETNAALFTTFPGYTDAGANPAEIFGYIDTSTGGHGINPGGGAGTAFRDNGNNSTNVAFIQAANGTIQQNVTGLSFAIYQLDFDYNARTGAAQPALTVSMGNGSFFDPQVFPVGGANPYYTGSFQFAASSPTELLTILKTNAVAGDSTVLIDNLSLTVVYLLPEPSTALMLGLGLVSLASRRRRR